ncbi:MAG: hypothetical protein FD174_4105 [Geobacteraceae bacterium]|nr:MAG: hypothetical protein FD174_4105 [Geobacteraceae bacterium]
MRGVDKHFLLSDKSFAPYLYAGILASYAKQDDDRNFSSETYAAGALGGVGLEWFPIRNFSIGGHVGAQAQYEARRQTFTAGTTITPTGTFFIVENSKEEGYSVNTFSSGVRINLFF